MRKIILVGAAVIGLGAMAPEATEARPGGCLKYGVGGAVAGHFAGGHRWRGLRQGVRSACISGVGPSDWRGNVSLNRIAMQGPTATSVGAASTLM